jgi:hypothetical protein
MSRLLIYTGLLMIAAGLLVAYAPWIFSWFGRLPGDIRIEGRRGSFYFPVVSLLLVSAVASIILNLFRR